MNPSTPFILSLWILNIPIQMKIIQINYRWYYNYIIINYRFHDYVIFLKNDSTLFTFTNLTPVYIYIYLCVCLKEKRNTKSLRNIHWNHQWFTISAASHGDLGSYTQVTPVAPCSGRRCQPFPGRIFGRIFPMKWRWLSGENCPWNQSIEKRNNKKNNLVIGGFNFQPLWKILVDWDDYSQYMEKEKLFQTTKQKCYLLNYSSKDSWHVVIVAFYCGKQSYGMFWLLLQFHFSSRTQTVHSVNLT